MLGQSGNPAGRPIGARGRFSQQFIADLTNAWEQYGADAQISFNVHSLLFLLLIWSGPQATAQVNAPRTRIDAHTHFAPLRFLDFAERAKGHTFPLTPLYSGANPH